MSTGNVMGKLVTPTLAAAPGIWNLRENQLAVQAGAWPGITAADATPFNNILTTKAVGAGLTTTTFRDGSTNNFAVTRNGDVTQGTLSPYFPTGYWSAYFDGSGDYLSATAGTPLNLGTGDFTVEAWVNFNTQAGTIVSTYGGWWLQYRSDYGGFCFGVGDTFTLVRTWTWTANQWIHVAVTRSGTSLRMFFNGVQQGATLTDSTNFTVGSTLYCGALFSGFNHLNGYISNLRVVKGTAVYTSNFTPSTEPLIAITNTSLLALQDNRFKDNSTNNLAITKAGDAAATRFSPFKPPRITAGAIGTGTGSVYFDGSGDYLTIPSNSTLAPGAGDFTFECWINPSEWSSSGIYKPILSGSVGNSITLTKGYNSANLEFINYGVGGNISSGVAPAVGVWSHVVLVRSGTTASIFINGSRTATGTSSYSFVASTYYMGGLPSDGNFTYLNAYISNARFVKGTAVYDPTLTTLTVPASPLTAISGTSLLTAQSESTVTDASSNALTITKNGDAKADAASPFKGAICPSGGSGYFNGSTDYLQIASNLTAFSLPGDFTIEFWICPVGSQTYRAGIVMHRDTAGWTDGAHWGIRMETDAGKVGFGYGSDGSYYDMGTYDIGAWSHHAVTRSGTTLKTFKNGVLVSTVTNSSAFSGDVPIVIGRNYVSGLYYSGYISNARIVKGAAVYTAAFTPPTTPVTAISGTGLLVNFDNAGIYDSIGRSDLRTLGTAKVSASTTKWGAASIALDGTANCCVKAVPVPDQPYTFGTADFTIEMWFYLTSMGSYPALFDWRPASTSTASPCIMVSYGGASKLTYYMGTSTAITGTTNITAGTWYHAAVCRASGVTRLFLNGAQEGSNYSDTNSYTGTNPTFGALGYDPSLTTYNLNGYLEDIRVTRAARYTTAFIPPTAPFA